MTDLMLPKLVSEVAIVFYFYGILGCVLETKRLTMREGMYSVLVIFYHSCSCIF